MKPYINVLTHKDGNKLGKRKQTLIWRNKFRLLGIKTLVNK